MWFVARDLAFGAGAYPDVEPTDNIARPDDERRIPELRGDIEGLVSFLANPLLIEFRAELGFSESQPVLRTPALWGDRTAQAAAAAETIGRIPTAQANHATPLSLSLRRQRP